MMKEICEKTTDSPAARGRAVLRKVRGDEIAVVLKFFDRSDFHFFSCGPQFLPTARIADVLRSYGERLYFFVSGEREVGLFYYGEPDIRCAQCCVEFAFDSTATDTAERSRLLARALTEVHAAFDIDRIFTYVYDFDTSRIEACTGAGMTCTGRHEEEVFLQGAYWDLLIFYERERCASNVDA
jgi:hypothetical protein